MKVLGIRKYVAPEVTRAGKNVQQMLRRIISTEGKPAGLQEHQGQVLDVNLGDIVQDTVITTNPVSGKIRRVSSFFLDF